MLNPIRLCNDLFDERDLFDHNLRSFTEDHLVRLSQPENNPGGIYSGLVTSLTTKYNAYYGKITNEAVKKAIAEGTTITRNNARKECEEKISQIQGLVKFKFGETSATYQEFYPLGVREYQDAREGDIGTLFDRFVSAATTHLTADFPDEVTAITELVEAFDTAYTARETAASQVDIAGTGKRDDRKALTMQLTTNFLTIAINNIDNPDKYDDYYDPRYLPIEADNGIREGTVAAGAIASVPISGLTINADTNIELKNNGPTDLLFYFAPAPDTPAPITAILVAEGQELNKTALELGFAITNTRLLVSNPGEKEGEWHVVVG